MTWAIGVMPARVWARGVVNGTGPVVFGGPSDPDYARDGYSHAFTTWPDYAYAQYTIQQGVKWETGFGEFVMLPDIDSEGSFVRLDASQSSAGDGVFESFENDFCDIAIVPTSSSTQQRMLASYGDGSDGDVTISSAVTLTRPMFYNNLTISPAGAVNTGGYAVFVAGSLILPDTRSTGDAVFSVAAGSLAVWLDGGATAQGGLGGFFDSFPLSAANQGDSSSYSPARLGGVAGSGGDGAASSGGGFSFADNGAMGGTVPTTTAAAAPLLFQPRATLLSAQNGAGGGGGGADSNWFGMSQGGTGGDGGAAGGVIQVYARTIIGGASDPGDYVLAQANGGVGSAGFGGSGSGLEGNGGPGGGGGGGALLLATEYVDRAPWLLQADGGDSGGGTATGGGGGAAYCYVHGAVPPRVYVTRDTAPAPTGATGNTYRAPLTAIGASQTPEMGYIRSDGINDYAHAYDAALAATAAGTAGEVCLIVKTANRTATFVGVYGQLCDVANAVGANTESATAALVYSGGATTSVVVRTWAPDGAGSASTTLTLGAGTGLTVAAIKTDAPLLRGIGAEAGVTLDNQSIVPSVARDADHVILGARITPALAPANFVSLDFVAAVVLNRAPTAGELATYSDASSRDARTIWPDAVHAYWAAADVVGTSIPARVGTVPMTLAGGWSAAELVIP